VIPDTRTDLVRLQDRPRYYTVYRAIAEEIEQGILRPGDRLPVERALCDRFQVSRATVRRALGALADQGLIESHERRGSFVSLGLERRPTHMSSSLSEMAAERGFRISANVLVQEVRPAGVYEAEQLHIAPGAQIFDLERIRLLEDRPIGFEKNLVPFELVPGIEKVDFAVESLFATLGARGVQVAQPEYGIEALAASPELAAQLDGEPGMPILAINLIAHGPGGDVVCVTRQRFRGDRYRFRQGRPSRASSSHLFQRDGGGAGLQA
jgi:GntR family transcriptional regulator